MNPIDFLNIYENTPYKILGLEKYQGKDIESNILCQKYYTLAKKYHPDAIKAGVSEQEKLDTRLKFNVMALAFSILNSSSLKRNYDQLGNVTVDSIFNNNDDSLTSYSKGLWLGVKISVENKRSTIAQPNGTSSSFYNIGSPIQKHDGLTPNDMTSLVKYNPAATPALKQKKESQRNSNQKSNTTTCFDDSYFTSSVANKKHYIVKPLNSSFRGSAVQFSDSNPNDNETPNMHVLQRIYHIPDGVLKNEDEVNDDGYDQEEKEYVDDEMDQATIYDKNELEIEKDDFMDDEEEEEGEEEEEEEDDDEEEEDGNDFDETLSESVPLEFEELAKQTREKQIQRGRELFQKYNNMISHSVLGKREYLPSEKEFAAAQERILKNQKENQEKRASKKKKRY
ncbi:unnamed protein product [Cunninghamella echinulata]